MLGYILKRILLIIPTMLCIILINFFIVQLAPGGPVEITLAKIRDLQQSEAGSGKISAAGQFKSSKGLDPEIIEHIKKLYGFDKPAHERLWLMIKNYITFDLGYSYFRNKQVGDLILEILQLLQPDRILLGVGRHAFGTRDMLGDRPQGG